MGNYLGDELFAALLSWFMVSDPWLLTEAEHELILNFLDFEAEIRGYADWIEAYHEIG